MQLARKYRPRLLADLIGQPSVVQTLTNSFNNNKIHQSYLFVGLFGSGKTSAARIVAAMENCEVSPGLTPCGKCSICVAIFEGSHTDIQEIDAASNAGNVEQVRKIKQNALYNPVDGAITKYFIIDECLPKEALITMSNGQKIPIGELVEGGLLNKYKENIARSRNMNTGKTFNQRICRYIKILNDKQMYKIGIKDENGDINFVKITGNHNVFIEGDKEKQKIKAQDLQIGQKVFLEK